MAAGQADEELVDENRVARALRDLNDENRGGAVGIRQILDYLRRRQEDGEVPVHIVPVRQALDRLIRAGRCRIAQPGFFLSLELSDANSQNEKKIRRLKPRRSRKRSSKLKRKRGSGTKGESRSVSVSEEDSKSKKPRRRTRSKSKKKSRLSEKLRQPFREADKKSKAAACRLSSTESGSGRSPHRGPFVSKSPKPSKKGRRVSKKSRKSSKAAKLKKIMDSRVKSGKSPSGPKTAVKRPEAKSSSRISQSPQSTTASSPSLPKTTDPKKK